MNDPGPTWEMLALAGFAAGLLLWHAHLAPRFIERRARKHLRRRQRDDVLDEMRPTTENWRHSYDANPWRGLVDCPTCTSSRWTLPWEPGAPTWRCVSCHEDFYPTRDPLRG